MQTNMLRVLTGKDASMTFQRRMMHPTWMPTGFGIRSPDRSADMTIPIAAHTLRPKYGIIRGS